MTQKIILAICLVSFNYLPALTQSVDSLMNLIALTKDKQQQVELWNEISNRQQPTKGKEAAEKALHLAQKINFPEGVAEANYHLGRYHYLKENTETAKSYMKRAFVLYDSLHWDKDKTESLIYLSEMHYFEEAYTDALNYLKEAEKTALKLESDRLLAMVFQTMSYIYNDGLKETEKGKNYLLKSNELLKNGGSVWELCDNYLNLSSFFVYRKQVDSSLYFIQEGEKLLYNSTDSSLITYMSNNYDALKGTCYVKQGKLDSAYLFIKKSLPFFIENENWYSVAWSYTDLAELYLKKKNFKKAVHYAKASIEKDITVFGLEENLILLRDAYQHLDQDSFILYNEKYITFLSDPKHADHINDIQKKLKEAELKGKEEELNAQRRNWHITLGGILLLSLIYAIGFFFYHNKTKSRRADLLNAVNGKTDAISNKGKIKEPSTQLNPSPQKTILEKATQLKLEQQKIADNAIALQLKNNLHQGLPWEVFIQQFEQIHPGFFQILVHRFPNLSSRELRLCAYGRLGLTNQETAQILGIAYQSVGKARHRMKKKMNLSKEQDLNQFLLTV